MGILQRIWNGIFVYQEPICFSTDVKNNQLVDLYSIFQIRFYPLPLLMVVFIMKQIRTILSWEKIY